MPASDSAQGDGLVVVKKVIKVAAQPAAVFRVVSQVPLYPEIIGGKVIRKFSVDEQHVVTTTMDFQQAGLPLDFSLRYMVSEAARSVSFRLACTGDFQVLEGAFSVDQVDGETVLVLEFQFKFGLGEVSDAYIQPIVQKNAERDAELILSRFADWMKSHPNGV